MKEASSIAIEACRGLVEHIGPRIERDDSGKRDATTLAARQLKRADAKPLGPNPQASQGSMGPAKRLLL